MKCSTESHKDIRGGFTGIGSIFQTDGWRTDGQWTDGGRTDRRKGRNSCLDST